MCRPWPATAGSGKPLPTGHLHDALEVIALRAPNNITAVLDRLRRGDERFVCLDGALVRTDWGTARAQACNLSCPGVDGGSDGREGSLSWDSRKYPDELRERATRMALEALADPARAKGAIRRIGEELGVYLEVLRTWVKKAQVDGGLRPGTTADQAQRIKELEKEVREL